MLKNIAMSTVLFQSRNAFVIRCEPFVKVFFYDVTSHARKIDLLHNANAYDVLLHLSA